MTDRIAVRAEFRERKGKGASRRLRRQGKTPGVLYGGGVDPVTLAIGYDDLAKAMQEEAFFSQILELAVGDKKQACILREVQRHPATERVQHIDFLRIQADQPVQIHVPLHFINEEQCVGVKIGGGLLSRNLIEVEVSCLPQHLPEFLEVDVGELEAGHSLHLSDLTLPDHVTVVALGLGADHDIPVVSVTARRGGVQEDEEDEDKPKESEGEDEAPESD